MAQSITGVQVGNTGDCWSNKDSPHRGFLEYGSVVLEIAGDQVSIPKGSV